MRNDSILNNLYQIFVYDVKLKIVDISNVKITRIILWWVLTRFENTIFNIHLVIYTL